MKRMSRAEYEYTIRREVAEANELTGTNIAYATIGEIEIIRTNDCFGQGKEPAKFGVNWSALGTKSPEETEAFVYELHQAAEIAEALTKAELVCDWSMSDDDFISRASEAVRAGAVSDVALEILERMSII